MQKDANCVDIILRFQEVCVSATKFLITTIQHPSDQNLVIPKFNHSITEGLSIRPDGLHTNQSPLPQKCF